MNRKGMFWKIIFNLKCTAFVLHKKKKKKKMYNYTAYL